MSNNGDNKVPTAGSRRSQEDGGSSNQTVSGGQTQESGNSDGNNINQIGVRRARNKNRDRIVNEIKKIKEETTKMNGHVFQLHAKRSNKTQFTNTMEALRIHALTAYKIDIDSMNILFTELKTPEVEEPEGPKEAVKTDEDGNTTTTISRFEEIIYSERIKQ